VIAIVAGLGACLLGLAVVALALPALVAVGFDDTLDTGDVRLASPTAAIASAEASLGDETLPDRRRSAEETWDLDFEASSSDGAELFVGIGPADEVEAWLDEQAWDKVSVFSYSAFSVDATDVTYERLGASGDEPEDLPEPAGEDFWTVSDTGEDVSLDWDYREGHHTLVLMKADGSTGVDAEGSVQLTIPRIAQFFAALVGLGVVILGVGIVLLFVIARRRRRRRAAELTTADDDRETPDVAAVPVPVEESTGDDRDPVETEPEPEPEPVVTEPARVDEPVDPDPAPDPEPVVTEPVVTEPAPAPDPEVTESGAADEPVDSDGDGKPDDQKR
jgi:hypothetical protein